MDQVIIPWIKDFVQQKGPFESVLELGSRNINGTIRPAFEPVKFYIGLDMIDGPDVDIVANVHNVPYLQAGFFDCIASSSFFEHDLRFWETLLQVRRIIKKGGWMILTVPFNEWGVHDYPGDYYRYMPEAIEQILFEGFSNYHFVSPIHPGTQIHGAWGQWL